MLIFSLCDMCLCVHTSACIQGYNKLQDNVDGLILNMKHPVNHEGHIGVSHKLTNQVEDV